jgi:hypothetical protein
MELELTAVIASRCSYSWQRIDGPGYRVRFEESIARMLELDQTRAWLGIKVWNCRLQPTSVWHDDPTEAQK